MNVDTRALHILRLSSRVHYVLRSSSFTSSRRPTLQALLSSVIFSDDSPGTLVQVGENQNHTSLAYGADWCYLPPCALPNNKSFEKPSPQAPSAPEAQQKESCQELERDPPSRSEGTYKDTDDHLLASCSFYDHAMQIWLKP